MAMLRLCVLVLFVCCASSMSSTTEPSPFASLEGIIYSVDADARTHNENPVEILIEQSSVIENSQQLDFHETPKNEKAEPADEKEEETPQGSWRSWLGVVLISAMIVGGLTPIYAESGIYAFSAAFFYISGLILVMPLVKTVFKSGFHFPYTITCLHMLMTAAVAFALSARSASGQATSGSDGDVRLKIAPVSLLNSGSLMLGNTALLYGTAAFCTMVASVSPVTMYIVELVRRQPQTMASTVCVLGVSAGGFLCTYGQTNFSILALIVALGAAFCRSMKSAWQHSLLHLDVNPIVIVAWSSTFSFLLTLPVQIFFEGLAPFRMIGSGVSVKLVVCIVLSGMAACVLNVAQIFAVKHFGPLLQSVMAQLNLVMGVMLAMAWLHDEVTIMQWVGVFTMIVSCGSLSAVKMKAKKAEEKAIQSAKPDYNTIENTTETKGRV